MKGSTGYAQHERKTWRAYGWVNDGILYLEDVEIALSAVNTQE